MKEYTAHYLMIKTHNITKLKYLCKKSTDKREKCFSYKGSGTYWKKHLSKHGDDITTEIIEECSTKQELTQKGIYWSKKLNVVASPEFANLVEERGDGGPTMLGRQITKDQKIKQGKAISDFWKTASQEYKELKAKINSLSHALKDKKIYATPLGEFLTCTEASIKNSLSSSSIKNHCMQGSLNKIVDSRRMGRDVFLKKTWKELGYDMRDITDSEYKVYMQQLSKYKTELKALTI